MKAINVVVEDEVYDALRVLAVENRRNMKQQLATLIIKAYDRHWDEPPKPPKEEQG